MKKLKEMLVFKYTNDSDELYHPKNIKTFDNAELTGSEIANALKEMLPNMPTNLVFFHDEIKKINGNYIFVICKDLIEAARIANRSSLVMDYMNVIDNHVVMIFNKQNNMVEITKIEMSKPINEPVTA